jgi:hypothetical protein
MIMSSPVSAAPFTDVKKHLAKVFVLQFLRIYHMQMSLDRGNGYQSLAA